MAQFEAQADKAAANSKAAREAKSKESKEEREKREKYEKLMKKAEEMTTARITGKPSTCSDRQNPMRMKHS